MNLCSPFNSSVVDFTNLLRLLACATEYIIKLKGCRLSAPSRRDKHFKSKFLPFKLPYSRNNFASI